MKTTLAVLAAAAGLNAIPSVVAYEFLDFVPLEARQETSGEKFECHAACGYFILGAEEDESHCDNSTWTGLLDECLGCAEEFDIWKHYGGGVTDAAETCDLEAVPEGAEESSTNTESSSQPEETGNAGSQSESEDDDDSAGSQLTSSSSVMLFAMIAAAGLL